MKKIKDISHCFYKVCRFGPERGRGRSLQRLGTPGGVYCANCLFAGVRPSENGKIRQNLHFIHFGMFHDDSQSAY